MEVSKIYEMATQPTSVFISYTIKNLESLTGEEKCCEQEHIIYGGDNTLQFACDTAYQYAFENYLKYSNVKLTGMRVVYFDGREQRINIDSLIEECA